MGEKEEGRSGGRRREREKSGKRKRGEGLQIVEGRLQNGREGGIKN